MATKKEQPRRRSLNDRLDAELASAESIPVAGINTESNQHEQGGADAQPSPQSDIVRTTTGKETDFPTKKATTIMPKEVFAALQHYCTDTDTPKHRAIYRFIIDGLLATGTITDNDYQRYSDMAAQLTTTYEKKSNN